MGPDSNSWFKGLRNESSKSKSRGSLSGTDDQLTPRTSQETSRRTSMPNKPVTSAAISPLPAVSLKPPLPSFSKSNITPRTSSVYIKNSSIDGSVSLEEGSVEESGSSSLELNLEERHEASFSFNGAEGESVQVMVRVRPCNQQEIDAAAISGDSQNNCLRIPESGSTIIATAPGREPKRFTYDRVLPESSTQEDVFEAAGMPMVDNVLAGYNSSLFCYGQTGSGKVWSISLLMHMPFP